MKNLFLTAFCLMLSYFAIGQAKTTSPIKGKYMEIRFFPRQGVSFRLASDLPFQKAGIFNKNLKPYFKQYDESLRYHKQHNRSYLGMAGGSAIYAVGFTSAFFGVIDNNPTTVRVGSASALAGLGLLFWANHRNISSIHKAVDVYNLNKNPNIKDIEYLEVFPHPITMWQFRTSPTEDYKSVGLYGRNMKTHFQEDEAAFRAYKKYKAGHMSYSIGNIAALTGTGIMLLGVLSNNSDVSRTGLFTSAGGLVATFIGISTMNKNIYQAVDLINYKKLPALNSSLMPSLQPSSHSAGLALVWDIQ